MAEGETPENAQPAPKHNGKALKVVGLVIGLVIVIAILLFVAFYAKDFLPAGPTGGEVEQPQQPSGGELIGVGTPGASSTISQEGATEEAIEEGFETGDEAVYVFCEQLGQGDKVATQGDEDKYSVSGPVWFAYVDELPGAFFEHDVKYIFIDASTGEKTVYEESWPPDINGEDMFDAAEDCGGVIEIQAI